MKSILGATDLSIRSDRAVQRALRLAATLDLPCRIVLVIDSDLPDDLQAALKQDVEQRLNRMAEGAAAGRNVTCAVLPGNAAWTIVDHAEGAGLIVLGLHRPRPFMDLVLGSTMTRIVRAS